MMAVLREGSNTIHIMIGKKVPSAPEGPCDSKRKLYMDASIVIPTKNGGQRLASVLKAIFSQNTRYEYEVICIDSGSTDATLDVIRSFPSCRLVQIAPEDFGHGRTRNLGASLSSGEFVIFVTQDALPASDRWLESFSGTTVGLCRECVLQRSLPVEPNDLGVHVLVSDRRVLRF